MSMTGCVDLVAERSVHGWAWDPERPGERLLVWVEMDGRLLGATRADLPRQDLAGAGIGDGAHAFRFTIPDEAGEVGDVRVLLDDMAELPRSAGFTVDAATNAAPSPEWLPGPGCRLPSFFVLGAAKCGTTSLHDYLGQHPDVCMSNPKEPFFFELEHELGAGWYRNRYFAHWRGESFVGESRHRNLYLPFVAERIHRHNPGARLVALLRDPVDRLVSHWWHWRVHGLEPLDLEAAVDADLRRLEAGLRYERPAEQSLYRRTLLEDGKGPYRSYVDSGHYAEQLRSYLERFRREQLLVLRFDDLVEDPRGTVERVLAFIGADPAPAASFRYPHLNRARPGAERHVSDDLRERLGRHYEPHERALEALIGMRTRAAVSARV